MIELLYFEVHTQMLETDGNGNRELLTAQSRHLYTLDELVAYAGAFKSEMTTTDIQRTENRRDAIAERIAMEQSQAQEHEQLLAKIALVDEVAASLREVVSHLVAHVGDMDAGASTAILKARAVLEKL